MFKNIFCYSTYMAYTTYMYNNIYMFSGNTYMLSLGSWLQIH